MTRISSVKYPPICVNSWIYFVKVIVGCLCIKMSGYDVENVRVSAVQNMQVCEDVEFVSQAPCSVAKYTGTRKD